MGAERRRARDQTKSEAYREFMRELLTLDHMNEVAVDLTKPHYYMTHHIIERSTSLTTKWRVVFNASFKSSTNFSLNDLLMVGPTIQPEVFVHLIRWRQNLIALTADITKMYRQIEVRPEDRWFQLIWWRNSDRDELKSYALKTVTYGTASAPFAATRTLKQLAIDQVSTHPTVAPQFENNFYVDDYINSFPTLEAARFAKKGLNELAAKGGFELRKWSSNIAEFDDELTQNEPTTSILGVPWNRLTDQILMSFSQIKLHNVITRANILSEIAQLFDPLGLCAPVVLTAKITMQKLWQLTNVSWDDQLPDDIAQSWCEFRNQLIEMPTIKIPRAILVTIEPFTVHGFADASEDGYGACIYLVSGENSRLICSKSRVAPLKRLSVPRLELNAAVLLAQLLSRVLSAMARTPEAIYYWSDSEITIHRIKNSPARFNVYVGVRVAEIQQLTEARDWLYVPTLSNPADIVSRGLMPSEIAENDLWWHGPQFIRKIRENWPSQEKFAKYEVAQDEEAKKTACDVFAAVIDTEQAFFYHNEINLLAKNRPVQPSSSLKSLNPFLDEDGLLRVGGRLANSGLTFDHQHQIIVPAGKIAESILLHLHRTNCHCGPQLLLATSRQKYWIIGARSTARKVVQNCVICFRQRPRLIHQIMGQLPAARLSSARPFATTGVDYAGPFFIRPQPRAKVLLKVYVAVFTCFYTRATHLEAVENLTTLAFLDAFRRFVARRGIPSEMWSDNATNLVGGRTELGELRQLLVSSNHTHQVELFCSQNRINWRHIPPRSPHWGGLWESAVKQFKYHFKTSTHNHTFDWPGLTTVLCQVEAVLNSRPLTPAACDIDDFAVLTPGHFLVGQPLNLLPEPMWDNLNFNRLKAWQQRQSMVSRLWERFHLEYVLELQRRAKWTSKTPDINLNQIVLVHEDNQPPCRWKYGRIVELHPGKDSHVRMVTIRTADGILKRGIAKIAPLPILD